LLNDTSETLRILNRLRTIGVRVAMDDFGTGYSSLAYVQKFHFDRIKIDRHFVMRMTSDRSAAAIVKAVIAMARAMGVTTIAEGVETTDQARALIVEGCNEAQGFLYGRPMTIDAFLQTLVPDEHVG
jgi:EAL domain-containing protein (putative c-di-GMP-specific phosphodiesterase class I)